MPIRVLLVDDDEPILQAMADFFRLRGYEVESARELAEAEALLANRRYSLVITDLRLSELDRAEGLEIIEEIQERYPWTRVILLTAYGTQEIRKKASESGVLAILEKPKPLGEIAAVVSAVLGEA